MPWNRENSQFRDIDLVLKFKKDGIFDGLFQLAMSGIAEMKPGSLNRSKIEILCPTFIPTLCLNTQINKGVESEN